MRTTEPMDIPISRKRLFGSLLLMALLFTPLVGRTASKPSEAELAAITKQGRLLAAFDSAVWHATDAVQATHPPDDLVRRYIATKSARGWTVDFGQLNEAKDRFLVSYEALQSESATAFVVKRFDPAREDEGFNLAAAKAIDTALDDFRGVDRPYNIAELPDDSTGLYVYVYLAQVKDNVYPLGADARYHFASNGSLIEKRQLHKSVIEEGSLPAGATSAAGYHTHVLTELPEDTDVFLVLTRRPQVPEYVGAGKLIFKINIDGSISLVDHSR